jgi:hypothetical protein
MVWRSARKGATDIYRSAGPCFFYFLPGPTWSDPRCTAKAVQTHAGGGRLARRLESEPHIVPRESRGQLSLKQLRSWGPATELELRLVGKQAVDSKNVSNVEHGTPFADFLR